MDRLAVVRERLDHGLALQRHLRVQIDELTAELETIRMQRDRTWAVLQSERAQAAVLEQRLDRLVPRLLARIAEVDQRRTQAAAVLADLARKTHTVRLDPRVRARMLALRPLLLERMRDTEHGAESARAHPDRLIAHQAQIERSLSELTRAQERLRREGTQMRRLRQMASDRLRELESDVGTLRDEETQLVQLLLRKGTAMVASAQAQGDQRTLPDAVGPRRASAPGAAAEEGAGDRGRWVAQVADAWDDVAARALLEAPAAGAAGDAAEPAAGGGWPTMLRAQAHPEALRSAIPPVWPSASAEASDGGASTLEVLFSPGGGMPGRTPGRARAARPMPPLLPMLDGTSGGPTLVARGGPELTIPAAPGQAVAAPVAGRVAFAGRFKSYGLLLILEHEREYHTLLWGFARLDVHHGDQVGVGQIVGIMDARSDDPPVLHVERRRNGRPVDIAASSNGIQG